MTRKTRLIILAICAVLFSIITPYIILYSLGSRVDIKKFKVVATGGMYVVAQPQGTTISVDSETSATTGIFSNSFFTQDLLPGSHVVTITKDGYYGYQKTLEVQEKAVTKLEHVTLIQQDISFDLLQSLVDYVSLSPNGNLAVTAKINKTNIQFEAINLQNQQKQGFELAIAAKNIVDVIWGQDQNKALVLIDKNYYLLDQLPQNPKITPLPLLAGATAATFDPQNATQFFFIRANNLYSTKPAAILSEQGLPLIKNVAAYFAQNQTITWLATDGFLYSSNVAAVLANKISSQTFAVNKTSAYELLFASNLIILKQDKNTFLFNQKTGTFESFYSPVTDLKMSPDNQHILLFNDHELAYFATNNPGDKIFLNRFSGTITEAYWLNNDYLIFNLGGKVVISEIDTRGNINEVTLPNTITLQSQLLAPTDNKFEIKTPKIFFNDADKKLYILTQGNLIVSERLVP